MAPHQNPALLRLHVRDKARTMVPVAYLKLLARYLRQHGLDLDAVMPELARALDGIQQGGRYPAEPYCQMLLRAAELLDDPLLGLHIGQTLAPRDLGALGYALSSCAHLGDALVRIQRYHRLVNDVTPMVHEIVADTLVLRWGVARGKMGAVYDEIGITAFIEIGRRLSGLHLVPRAVGFVNPPPDDPGPYLSYFGCPVSWAQPETSLTISLKSLQLPLLEPDRTLQQLMERQVDEDLATLVEPMEDLETAVRQAVSHLVRGGVPELLEVASELKMSPRVLYRRLVAQGLNFRVVREQALKELAETLLTSAPQMSLAEVGQRLGYTKLSAFIRAFKRWTGVTPQAWQRRQMRK